MELFEDHIGKGPETSKEALSGLPTRAAEHLTFPGLLEVSLFPTNAKLSMQYLSDFLGFFF